MRALARSSCEHARFINIHMQCTLARVSDMRQQPILASGSLSDRAPTSRPVPRPASRVPNSQDPWFRVAPPSSPLHRRVCGEDAGGV